MKTDDFEKRLQRVAPREVPSAWRSEILSAANQAASSSHAPRPSTHGWLATLTQLLSAALHPRRAVWAGLAATWIVIAVMNLSARDHSQVSTVQLPLPSPDTMQALRQQKLYFLAELAGQTTPREKIRPQPAPVGPRSHRREETFAV